MLHQTLAIRMGLIQQNALLPIQSMSKLPIRANHKFSRKQLSACVRMGGELNLTKYSKTLVIYYNH